MLSKEEVEYLNDLEKALEDNDSFYWQEDMHELINMLRERDEKQQNLIKKLKENNMKDRESVKRYEEMRRKCTDKFYLKSYQTTIHKLNAKREVISEILEMIKGENHE